MRFRQGLVQLWPPRLPCAGREGREHVGVDGEMLLRSGHGDVEQPHFSFRGRVDAVQSGTQKIGCKPNGIPLSPFSLMCRREDYVGTLFLALRAAYCRPELSLPVLLNKLHKRPQIFAFLCF